MEKNMYMTANRKKIDGNPVLKLNIHEYTESDIKFLDSLGINQTDSEAPGCRYIQIHSQDAFLKTRTAILERYEVLKETGPKVFLQAK